MTAKYEGVLAKHGLTVAEFEVLVAFGRRPGRVPIAEIARDLGESRTSITRATASLAKRELLTPHRMSIRRTYFVLTDQARRIVRDALRAVSV